MTTSMMQWTATRRYLSTRISHPLAHGHCACRAIRGGDGGVWGWGFWLHLDRGLPVQVLVRLGLEAFAAQAGISRVQVCKLLHQLC
jgi:hypothetical protein